MGRRGGGDFKVGAADDGDDDSTDGSIDDRTGYGLPVFDIRERFWFMVVVKGKTEGGERRFRVYEEAPGFGHGSSVG